MQLEILTFCDAAAEYGGRLNIIGATDHVIVPAVPFKYQRCCVVMRFRVARIEQGEHSVRLMLIDADGRPLVNVDGKINLQMAGGATGGVNMIVNINTLEFQGDGEHALEVAVDGIQIGSSPLFVRLMERRG